MTNWPPGIDRDAIAWIDLVRATLGTRGGVERALLELHLWDGQVIRHEMAGRGVAYETLTDEIEYFNRSRRRPP